MKEFVEKLIEKIKVTSLEIIVTGTKDKPYFEIKYKEVGKEDYHIGYSSYDLNNVFNWKDEYFEIANQLAEEYGKDTNVTTNADRIRSMSNEELAEFLCKITMHHPDYCPAYNNCMRKSKGGMKDWLQSEVKGSDV